MEGWTGSRADLVDNRKIPSSTMDQTPANQPIANNFTDSYCSSHLQAGYQTCKQLALGCEPCWLHSIKWEMRE
jgi:hypothetical protein